MKYIEAIIIGIIQGFTEFLPISSSGHLEIGKALFGNEAIRSRKLVPYFSAAFCNGSKYHGSF